MNGFGQSDADAVDVNYKSHYFKIFWCIGAYLNRAFHITLHKTFNSACTCVEVTSLFLELCKTDGLTKLYVVQSCVCMEHTDLIDQINMINEADVL